MTTAAQYDDLDDLTFNTSPPPRVVTGGANQGGEVSNTFLADHFPMVFKRGEKLPWSSPTTDSFDRLLRELFKAPETRDIVRALVRHRRGGEEGRKWNGTIVIASDQQLEEWTGIDASNIGRKVVEDEQLHAYVHVTRGKRRGFSNEIEATEYDLAPLFRAWGDAHRRDDVPPSALAVQIELDEWRERTKRDLRGDLGPYAKQALADVEAQLRRPLKRLDLKRVVKRAKELITKKGQLQ